MRNFDYMYSRPRDSKSHSIVIIFLLVLAIVVGVSMAWFVVSDYASNLLTMSGRVDIEAVGKAAAFASTEDTPTRCNLQVDLDKMYSVLIPGMPMEITANVKVKRSTTKPLLRAYMSVNLVNSSGVEVSNLDTEEIVQQMYQSMNDIIVKDNDWYRFSDGYYYYIGSYPQLVQGGYITC